MWCNNPKAAAEFAKNGGYTIHNKITGPLNVESEVLDVGDDNVIVICAYDDKQPLPDGVPTLFVPVPNDRRLICFIGGAEEDYSEASKARGLRNYTKLEFVDWDESIFPEEVSEDRSSRINSYVKLAYENNYLETKSLSNATLLQQADDEAYALYYSNKEFEDGRKRNRKEHIERQQKNKEKRKKITQLPEHSRDFFIAGSAHDLILTDWDELGGSFQFVFFEHVVPDLRGLGEPRPNDLPWVLTSSGIWVAFKRPDIPRDLDSGMLKLTTLQYCEDAAWPSELATPEDDAYGEFMYQRIIFGEAHEEKLEENRLRQPNFFSVDLYDVGEEQPYLVAGLLPEKGISVFAGDWDSGKTILLVDIAAHIAYGLPWLNREVSPRPVIYYGLEAGDDVTKRLSATSVKLEQGKGTPVGLGSVPVRIENELPTDYDEWKDELEWLTRETRGRLIQRCEDQSLPFPEDYPDDGGAVVIIDTLRQACGHKDRGPDVEEFFSKADRLVKEGVAAHVIIAHHTTKTGTEYAGDDFLASDSTSLYYVRRPNHDKPSFRLVCDRVKGIAKPPALSLLFKVVEIGKQQTVVLLGEANASPKLLEIAQQLPNRIASDGLREKLEPFLTGETDTARYKSFQRTRDNLLEAGLIAPEGDAYLRST